MYSEENIYLGPSKVVKKKFNGLYMEIRRTNRIKKQEKYSILREPKYIYEFDKSVWTKYKKVVSGNKKHQRS